MNPSLLPSSTTEADVADALSMSLIAGLQARALANNTRLPLDEAYRSARRFAPEVARSARGIVGDAQDFPGHEEQRSARIQAATALVSGLVAGLVTRREPIDAALLQASRARAKLWPAANTLADHPQGPAAAILAAGALQGCVASGQSPDQALGAVRARHQDLTASAAALAKVSADQFGEVEVGERLVAATHLYATAVSSLMAQGQSLEDALRAARRSREAIVAKTSSLLGEAATSPGFDAAVEAGARAVASAESWNGWDTGSATPNGNTPDEQRAWCRTLSRGVLSAALPHLTPAAQGRDAAVEAGARAVALAESWNGWDTDSATPNGNTPDEQRAWCRAVSGSILDAAAPHLSLSRAVPSLPSVDEWRKNKESPLPSSSAGSSPHP